MFLNNEQQKIISDITHGIVAEVWGDEAPLSCHRYAAIGCCAANDMLGYERYVMVAGSMTLVISPHEDPNKRMVMTMDAHNPLTPGELNEFHVWFVGGLKDGNKFLVSEFVDLSTRHLKSRCGVMWNRSDLPDYLWGEGELFIGQQLYLHPKSGLVKAIWLDLQFDDRFIFALKLLRAVLSEKGLIHERILVRVS